ncbi:MAG: dTDP-glucose 4,6-dehydratase [Streptosporangiaceae bacterium]|nr:dTDP-glucose 4,6-dehydratase [Streptosporangiaceae bacterium]
MKILVTGGAGFVGSHFVRKLLHPAVKQDDCYHVTVLDKLTYSGNMSNLEPVRRSARLSFVHGDISDAGLVNEVVPGHDAIINFAAESHVDRSIENARVFTVTNVLGTQVLLEAALRYQVEPFIQVSTDEVYGSVPSGWTDESAPLRPTSPYAASKAAADLTALSYYRTHGMDARISRCSNTYGPYQFPEKIIPLFVTQLLDGGVLPLYGDGLNVRQWIHVDDHCLAIKLILANGRAGEIYNIGGTALTNLDLARFLIDALGADQSVITYVADRKGHDRRYAVDQSKIMDELGFFPGYDLFTGLSETVAWYRENSAWWRPLRSRPGQLIAAPGPGPRAGYA